MEKINELEKRIREELKLIKDLKTLNDLKIKFFSKKGEVSILTSNLNNLSIEEKKSFGKKLNDFKTIINEEIDVLESTLKQAEENEKLSKEKIDIQLPATFFQEGSASVLESFLEEMEELFISLGYDVVEGPEVEKDLYNFELLNLPKGHPARDAQDTFYTYEDSILLRSQTSPVQIRTMLEKNNEPIRIICPGKVYRRDADDATHSHQFTQVEGLLIDKNISLANLKHTFEILSKHFFGEKTENRFRSSFYPFTEPSVELDISCFKCGGEGCSICKGTGWITVGGAGMVHPNVLKNCGYDPDVWSGFAFGLGAERWAMLKYEISDVRTFYNNDLRISKIFNREDERNEN